MHLHLLITSKFPKIILIPISHFYLSQNSSDFTWKQSCIVICLNSNISGTSCSLKLYPTIICHCYDIHHLWSSYYHCIWFRHFSIYWRIYCIYILQNETKKESTCFESNWHKYFFIYTAIVIKIT